MSIDDQLITDESAADLPFGVTSEVPDLELVARIEAEALIQAGYTRTDEDGQLVASEAHMRSAVVEAMFERHIVRSKKEFAAGTVTKFELYQEILPDGPGAQTVAETLEEKLAQARLEKKLWNYLNTGTTGYVQKHAAGQALVLCEGDVPRTKVNQENGRREPRTERGRFLTDDGELILTYYANPAGAAFMKAARRLEAQLGMVGARRPELVGRVAKQVGAMVKDAVGLVPHADLRRATTLTTGNGAALTAGNSTDAEGDQ